MKDVPRYIVIGLKEFDLLVYNIYKGRYEGNPEANKFNFTNLSIFNNARIKYPKCEYFRKSDEEIKNQKAEDLINELQYQEDTKEITED